MKNLLIILMFLAAGCTSRQQLPVTQVVEKKILEIEINDQGNDHILFTVKNNSTEFVKIYQPEKLKIEKFIEGSWVSLRILACPCGAPCARPQEYIDIPNGKIHTYTWDKYETWCGEKNDIGIPKTNKKVSESGKYRIKILYKGNKNEQQIIYKEFEI